MRFSRCVGACALAPLLCTAVQLPDASSLQLGTSVGNLLKQANEEVAVDAIRHPSRGQSDLQVALAGTLVSGEQVLVNPQVSEVVAEANELAAREVVPRDAVCNRNWTQSCPDGWDDVGLTSCKAPLSYGGACQPMQSFASTSLLVKQRFAATCKAPWPCEDECPYGRAYETCPRDWGDVGNGFCEALTGAHATCMSKYKFDDMTVDQKQELVHACGLTWDCKSPCEQNLGQTCPEAWEELNMNPGVCLAPANYAGDCDFSVNTTGMSRKQKRAFAAKCLVTFPCVGAPSHEIQSSTDSVPLATKTTSGAVDPRTGFVTPSAALGAAPDNASSKRALVAQRFGDRFIMPSGPMENMDGVNA